MRIVFMGTPDFAEASLKSLYDNRFDVCGVFTKQDKPVGRAGRPLFCEETEDDLEWAEAFDELDRPRRRRREPLMTPEQQAEYLATGATRGKRIREAEAQA